MALKAVGLGWQTQVDYRMSEEKNRYLSTPVNMMAIVTCRTMQNQEKPLQVLFFRPHFLEAVADTLILLSHYFCLAIAC